MKQKLTELRGEANKYKYTVRDDIPLSVSERTCKLKVQQRQRRFEQHSQMNRYLQITAKYKFLYCP